MSNFSICLFSLLLALFLELFLLSLSHLSSKITYLRSILSTNLLSPFLARLKCSYEEILIRIIYLLLSFFLFHYPRVVRVLRGYQSQLINFYLFDLFVCLLPQLFIISFSWRKNVRMAFIKVCVKHHWKWAFSEFHTFLGRVLICCFMAI